MALYANAHRGENAQPFTVEQFMPEFGVSEDGEVTEDAGAIVAPETKAWLYAMAGKKNGN